MRTLLALLIVLLASTAFAVDQKTVAMEKRWLNEYWGRQIARCEETNSPSKCRARREGKFKAQYKLLVTDPDYYFYKKAERERNKARTAIDQNGNVYYIQ